MADAVSFFRLILDGGMVAGAGWLLTRRTLPTPAPAIDVVLTWGIFVIASIAGAGVLLGGVGALGGGGFFLLHFGLLTILAISGRAKLRADLHALAELPRALIDPLRLDRSAAVSAAALGIFVAVQVALATLAKPVVYDALTYRLTRIGEWLQSGWITSIATDDPRINYMPVVPDLIMAWLLTGTRSGFAGVALAQAGAGVLLVVATVALARRTGLRRTPALLSAFLLFGMANVVPQFTSVHTDLFAAGVFAAAFCVWLSELERHHVSVVGGIGAGLALGSKGTLFYLAPGACCWIAWLVWRNREGAGGWRKTLAAAIVATIAFAVPGFVRNAHAYGSIFGPADYIAMHHRGAASAADWTRKVARNVASSFVQLFDPGSQPPGLKKAAAEIGRTLAQRLPENDPFAFEGLNRRQTLSELMARSDPDADATSFGIVTSVFFLLGISIACVRVREPAAACVVVWTAGVAVFLVFFHAMQQWHPYGFRYFVLVAPWVAVVSAWGIERLPGRVRRIVWCAALGSAAGVAAVTTLQTHQSGWRAVHAPERSRGYFVFHHWSIWSDTLAGSATALTLALPPNLPVSAFYRRPSGRVTMLARQPAETVPTAEDFVRSVGPGWVVVPATRFIGREGRVGARTWLMMGDETSPFSIAAYRPLAPGEKSVPFLYRHRRIVHGAEIEHSLLIKTWDDAPARLKIQNRSSQPWRFDWASPDRSGSGRLAPGEECVLAPPLPSGAVAEMKVAFTSTGHGAEIEPVVDLVP